MSAFEMDDSGKRYIDDLAERDGVPLGTPVDPGFFDGAAGAAGKGLMRGVVGKPAKLLGDVADPILRPVAQTLDRAFGTTAATTILDEQRRRNSQLLEDMKPDPATTGMAGQLLHGLFDIGSSAVLFTPEGAAMMEGYAKRQELIDKGVNPGTATAAGAATGAAMFAGIKAPMTMGAAAVGRGAPGLAANVAVGAVTNVTAGVAERGITSDLLERAGHKDMAEQYKPYDKQALIIETIMGSIFSGAAGAIEARTVARQDAINAALALNNAQHERKTAPGAPINAKSDSAYSSALERAIEQSLRGDQVNVADSVIDAEFIRPAGASGETPIAAAIREAYRDDLPAEARFAPSDRLLQVPVEQRRKLRFDAPELNEYAATVEQKYGLPAGLINALKNAGEKSGSTAVSPKGAQGVMQFMPENLKKYGVTDASDPGQIIDAAGRYLRDTMKQYGGNIDAVIADYNGGPRQARRVLNGEAPAAAETQAYLTRVRQYLGRGEHAARRGKEPAPEEFAGSVQRVAEVDQATGKPTFRDGTAYTREAILPFFDEVVSKRAVDANVPDVLFRIGRMDSDSASGLRQYLPGFNGAAREVQIGADAIKHISQLQPAFARHVLSRLEDAALYADEVLPNPLNREHALLVLSDGSLKKQNVVMLDVALTEQGIRVAAPIVGPKKNLDSARALKKEMDAARPRVQPEDLADQTKTGLNPESPGKWADTRAEDTQPGLLRQAGQEGPVDASLAGNRGEPPAGQVRAAQERGAGAPDQSQGAPNSSAGGDMPLSPETRQNAGISEAMPEVQNAREIVREVGDMVITLDDGTKLTAREALAQADDGIQQARTDAQAFGAAINCYLRKGS
ncbi:MAG TPA: hypothetical protein DHV59_01595 [Oxalobacteraceae bacterium]|nr:hypothetical protein [Oxalobacteraceae bacterium]